MLTVIDNFFMPWQLKLVKDEILKLDFYNNENNRVNPLLDSYIVNSLDMCNTPFTNKPYNVEQFGHLKYENENNQEYIHKDNSFDFAYLIYLSDTNLDSGTKMYETNDSLKNKENVCVHFVKNRLVIYDADISHMAWGLHGNSKQNGRLAITSFGRYI